MKGKTSLAAPLLAGAAALFAGGCMASLWVPIGPPDAVVDVHGVIPGPGYAWVDGYWEWHNRWAWQPGHWERPPRASAAWHRGYWEHGARGYRFHRGYWR